MPHSSEDCFPMKSYVHPLTVFQPFSGLIAMCSGVAPVYDLFAVLIHRGPTASSGHYMAVIKDPITGVTYKFNDTEVEKEKKFNLAGEDDSGNQSFHAGCL